MQRSESDGAAGEFDELEALHAILGADFRAIAELYQTDSPQRIAVLRQAGAAGDLAQAARVAHAFSGSCASIGAMRLCRLCKELEMCAANTAIDEFENKLAAVESEYRRVSGKLQAMLGLR